VSRKEIKE